jgi:hypothetical protein
LQLSFIDLCSSCAEIWFLLIIYLPLKKIRSMSKWSISK